MAAFHKLANQPEFGHTPNRLSQNFITERPNQKWAGDVSYIWTREGWSCLTVLLDLHSRRVIGWATSNRLKLDLTIRALDKAIALRAPPLSCIHHSDRGSQYRAHNYQKRLYQHNIKPSMSGKGNCYDNAAVETFFKIIKAELIWRPQWKARHQLEASEDYKVLRQVSVGSHLAPHDGSIQKLAIYIDLETTGLNPDTDEIIEVGMVSFCYTPDGRIFSISEEPFSALREPSNLIPEEVTKITGITQDMVHGKHIDPADVERFAKNAHLIIAHNAGFDGTRLSHLANGYGFFYDAHRTTTDCHAGIEVLSRELPMAKLLTTARVPTHRVWAFNAPFDLKDILKARSYRWNDGNDGRPKAWHSDIDQDEYKVELEFLENEIYGCSINLPVTEITAFERFSNRV